MDHKNGTPMENGRRLNKKLLLEMFSQVSAPLKKERDLETEEPGAKDLLEPKLPKDSPREGRE